MVDPSPDAFVGQQVANFRIDELVKAGSLSRIYLGRDVIQRRPVAVKIIDARQERDKLYLERFLREARGMMSAWWHQHITRVYYAAKRDGRYITVMEYVDGPNLWELSAHYGQDGELIPVDDVLRIGRAVAEALVYAHQRGVIHRDVKPSNVLMCMDGRILLTDFGLAPPIFQEEAVRTYGTPVYIAPEQIAAQDHQEVQADLYSLAVLLYELLVGRPPFVAEDADELLQQHVLATPPLPSSLNPQLNREVDAVLLKALAKLPEKRFADELELVGALELALGATMEVLTEDGEMPPLPAVMQSEAGLMPAVSQVSVVDKIAAQLEMSEVVAASAGRGFGRRWSRMLGCWLVVLLVGGVLAIGSAYAWPFVLASWVATPTAVPLVVEVTVTEQIVPTPTLSLPTVISATVIVFVTPVPATPTVTLLPTQTITAEPTATQTMLPPTATESPTATAVFDGPPIRFHYGRYSFYMLNPAVDSLQVISVGFQALAADGMPTGQDFRGRDWSTIYPDLESGRCMAIELRDAPSWLRPSECSAYNVTLTPPITYDAFWVDNADIDSFRVYWNGRDIGKCPVVTGVCELQLP